MTLKSDTCIVAVSLKVTTDEMSSNQYFVMWDPFSKNTFEIPDASLDIV